MKPRLSEACPPMMLGKGSTLGTSETFPEGRGGAEEGPEDDSGILSQTQASLKPSGSLRQQLYEATIILLYLFPCLAFPGSRG